MKNRNLLSSQRAPRRPGAVRTGTQMTWTRLDKDVDVTVTTTSGERFDGVVDQVTPDGIVMWLRLNGGQGRRLFIFSDVHETALCAAGEREQNPASDAVHPRPDVNTSTPDRSSPHSLAAPSPKATSQRN
jgi:hypothetical protein